MRDIFDMWSGSYATPTWNAGSFAYVARDLPLRSGNVALGIVKRGTKVVVLGGNSVGMASIYVLEARLWFPEELDMRFLLSVEAAALSLTSVTPGTSAIPTTAGTPAGSHAVVAESYARLVDDTIDQARIPDERGDEHASWLTSACAPVTILEEVVEADQVFQRVQQEREGVVLEGWINKPILRSWGPDVCDWRMQTVVEQAHKRWTPHGYQEVDVTTTTRAVNAWLKSTGTLTMIELDEQEIPQCVTKTWQRGQLLGDWKESDEAGVRWRSVEWFGATGRTLDIGFGGIDTRGRRSTVHCSDAWEVVRVTDAAIEVMPGRLIDLEDQIFAYHPADVTRWWRTPAACEAVLATRPSYSLQDPARKPRATDSPTFNLGSPDC